LCGNTSAPHNCRTLSAWVALRCWAVRALVLSRVQAAEPVHLLVLASWFRRFRRFVSVDMLNLAVSRRLHGAPCNPVTPA